MHNALAGRALLSLCCALIASMGHDARAEFVPRRYEARRTDVAPQLDGQLDEAVWRTALPIRDFYAYRGGGDPAVSSTVARVLWGSR